jgi:hypothetical protein
VERPVDYLRESFWRGYAFNELESANRDLHGWLDTVANRRIHGTHRQPVVERWQPEKPQLGALPAADYDDGRSWQVVGTPDVGRSVRRVESSWQSLIAW